MKLRLLLAAALLCLPISNLSADVTGSSNETGTTIIPNNDPGGIDSIITITENEIIQNVVFTIQELNHDFIGDLIIDVSHSGGTNTTLMHRVGTGGAQPNGDSSDVNGSYSFADGAPSIWQEAADRDAGELVTPGVYAASGVGESVVDLSNLFAGQSTLGTWTINISDNNDGNDGSFRRTSVQFTSTAVPEPGTTATLLASTIFGAIYLRKKYRPKS